MQFDWRNWRIYHRDLAALLRPYRPLFILVIVLYLANALLAMLGVGVLVPVLDLFTGNENLSEPTRYVQRVFTATGIPFTTAAVLVAFGLLVLGMSVFRYLADVQTAKLRYRLFTELSDHAYRNLMSVAYSFFHHRRKSDLYQVLASTGEVAILVFDGMNWVAEATLAAAMFTLLVLLSPALTALVVIFVALGGAANYLLNRRQHRLSRELLRLKMEYAKHSLEAIDSIRVVKSFANEEHETALYRRSLLERQVIEMRQFRLLTRFRALREPALFTVLLLLVAAARSLVHLGLTETGVYLLLLYRFIAMQQTLLDRAGLLVQKLPFASLAVDLLSTANKPYLPDGTRTFPDRFRTISLRDLDFAYQPGQPVLRNINLEIAANTTVAIVGRSGSGKSTLADLLLRFYDPTAGDITVDGVPLRDFARSSFLRQVAVVSQDSYIFNATVRENIRYGRLDATDAEIATAARVAYADEFIAALPQGYDTPLGDRGIRLSGGQKQRIALARALVRNAPILILDEATSALDTESERKIQQAISDLAHSRTIVVIAHRLSTIVNADQIAVIDDGRVAEAGTHQELLARGTRYHHYYQMQFSADTAAGEGTVANG